MWKRKNVFEVCDVVGDASHFWTTFIGPFFFRLTRRDVMVFLIYCAGKILGAFSYYFRFENGKIKRLISFFNITLSTFRFFGIVILRGKKNFGPPPRRCLFFFWVNERLLLVLFSSFHPFSSPSRTKRTE